MPLARRLPGLLATAAVLFLLLDPLVVLHARAIAALIAHRDLLATVSPFRPAALALLWRSLALCAGVFSGVLVLGVPVGFGLARGPKWWRVLAAPLCAMALAIPPALAAAPYVGLAVSAGVPEDGSIGTYALAVLVLSGCYFPIVAGATAIAIRALPPEEEEAALLFSGEATAWLRVLQKRVLPAALAGAFGSAALALWEMGAPDLLGWPTFSMHVYRSLAATSTATTSQGLEQAYELPAALAGAITGLPVLFLGVLLLAPAVRLLRSVELRASGSGSVFDPPVSKLATALCLPGTAILLAFPVLLIYRFASSMSNRTEAWQALSANNEEILNTLLLPGTACLILTAIGFSLAVLWRDWPAGWRRAVLFLALVPLLVTPVVLGVALVETWNKPEFGGLYDSTYGMTLVGYLNRFGPLVIALAVWSVQSVDEDLIRAARGLGASGFDLGLGILAPLLRVSIAGICALVFSLCAGELTVTVLVQAPGGATLPLPVFSLLHAGLSADVAVLSLLQCTLSGGAMVLATWFLGRQK